MKQQSYTVGDNIYSREQLIAFGKEHYPRFYWIIRGIGILFMFIGLLMSALVGIALLILNFTGVLSDPEFPTWAFFIPFAVFGFFFLAGLICFIVSFIGRSEEKYIDHAIAYLTKQNLKNNSRKPETNNILSTDDKEKLARYERLLKGGVISQEEYEQKTREILEK